MIIVVCPYCQKGKVRAPLTAIGASATCPHCCNCFTVVETKEAKAPPRKAEPAAVAPATRAAPSTHVTTAAIIAERLTSPLPDEESPASEVEADPVWTGAAVARLPEPPDVDEETRSTFGMALISLILAGVALAASQFPYGRFVTVILAVAGLGVGVLSLAVAYRGRRWPLAGCGLNAAALVLATLLPSWLGMKPWIPERVVDDSTVTKAMPFNGDAGSAVAGGWVDASKGSWQLGDVRVSLSSASVGQVELAGPKDKRKYSKQKFLILTLRLSNVGVARRLDYKGWNEAPPPQGEPVRVTDSTGKVLAPAKFEAGWDVPGRGQKTSLFPGKTADELLVFEAPAAEAESLRIELPFWAVAPDGAPPGDPVRFQVPRSIIQMR